MSLQVSGRSRGRAQGAHPPPLTFGLICGPKGREKIFFRPPHSPYLRVWMTEPPPLSEGLDPPMQVHYNVQVTFLVVSRQLMALYSSYQTPEYNTIN